jgi:PhzF family phenazine biosynthesis protein
MMQRRFMQVDVFSAQPLAGNPLAVVIDGNNLDDDAMQRFANWTNLSETTFLLPPAHPSADYHARIFTTTTELPFAGHPTLGSCHAWLAAGGKPKQAGVVVQECRLGLISIRREAELLAFAAPALRKTGPLDDALLQRMIDGLGISSADVLGHQWLVNGPAWIGLHLRDANCVLSVRPDFVKLKGLDFGLIGAHPAGHECDFEVRGLSFAEGPIEDPVTGSLNAGFAQWLIGAGIAPSRYLASQGTAMGRRGRIYVSQDDDGLVWIGGHTHTVISGHAAF